MTLRTPKMTKWSAEKRIRERKKFATESKRFLPFLSHHIALSLPPVVKETTKMT